jgi:hypothetical protein
MEKSSIEHEVEKLRQELAVADVPPVEPEDSSDREEPEEIRHLDSPAAPGLKDLISTVQGGLRAHPKVAVAFFAFGFLTGRFIGRRR